jgi:ATP-dependent Clp protease ATP-binding subunit ClpC
VIVFNALEQHDIDLIIEIELKKLYARIKDLGYELNLSDTAKAFIAEKGFDKQFGARPLKRAIQKYVEDPVSEEVLRVDPKENSTIKVSYDTKKEKIVVKITK